MQLFQVCPVSDRQQFAAGGLKFFQVPRRLRLDVAANERLGAAGTKGNPFAVRQKEFVAVGGGDFFHLERANILQTAAEF